MIDLRTVQPLDVDTLVKSVEKTGRVIVVQEAQKQAGVGANVVAELSERAIPFIRSTDRPCCSARYNLSIYTS